MSVGDVQGRLQGARSADQGLVRNEDRVNRGENAGPQNGNLRPAQAEQAP